MLRRLKVENYALIDRLELELDDRLNIITGETGAGKSILLGALGLLLGNKNDNATLKDDKRNCLIEAFSSRNKGPAGILRPKRPGLQPRNDTHAPDHPGRQEPLVHQRHSRSPCVAARTGIATDRHPLPTPESDPGIRGFPHAGRRYGRRKPRPADAIYDPLRTALPPAP